ncbi:MAG TPA: DUF2789 domain-containing protein [Methylophaga aminisulfidivorans]|uniref:DUF2789 domain-containing protein n=1 Tax=Methylophaga aminisulfidivorans TaxID=230105 RepID=A0A7C1W0T3_9GAMM|nr:DUF2789 domain-containing protein [Methylophaga aminisulfidivorans]
MDANFHTLENLFLQLGLDNDDKAIPLFTQTHQLPADRRIEEADFWSDSQAAFIKECLAEDSDWAEVVDQLNALLHE